MPIDFPNSPINGQEFTSGATTWAYNGTAWDLKTTTTTSNDSMPVGSIMWFAGTTAPTGWVLCNGATYTNSTYPNLVAVIGTTFGGTPGTNFMVPNISATTGAYYIRFTTAVGVTSTLSLLSAPVGSMVQWPVTSSYPTGWLRCDGSNISRTSYADLFALIGTTYGTGDGSSTFTLPNISASGAGSPVYIIKSTSSGLVEPSTVSHAASHVRGGSDIIDADRAQIDYVPTTYTRNSAASEAGAVTDLTAHLSGINNAYLPLSGGTMTGAINSASTLNLATGGTNRLSIDSSGRVTNPSQPSFLAVRSSDITHNCSSQVNPVVFNSTSYNIGGHYNTSNGRFTAPVSGTYIFNGGIYCNTAISQLWFIIDGARERSFMLDNTANANVAGTGIVYLNAGQWIGMTPWCGGSSSVLIYTNGFHTYFRGALLF